VIGEDGWHIPEMSATARGICGSGIIDAIAELFKFGIIDKSGMFSESAVALYVGARILMHKLGVDKVARVILAGAFGSYIDK